MKKENNASQQELIMQFQMFEQQIRIIQEQIQAVEQVIIDLESLNFELDELVGKKDKEIIAPIGRGIYASAKLISEELLVDIGNKNFVKKSIPETKTILQKQTKKLKNAKEELNKELEKINTELTNVFMKYQKPDNHIHHGCECGDDDCECNH